MKKDTSTNFIALLRRVLARMPKRLSRFGYALLRPMRLPRLANDQPLALVATHDLSLSGAPRTALDLARALMQMGYQVVAVAMADGPMRKEYEAAGVTLLIDPMPRRKARYLRNLATKAEIALANTVVCAPLVDAWSKYAPVCWYLHELSLLEHLLQQGRIARPLTNAGRIWTGSELCARIVRPYRLDTVVLPYGLAPVSAGTPFDNDFLDVGIFGSVEPRKGQDLAIDGLLRLAPEDRARIRLHFYGRLLDPLFAKGFLDHCATIEQATYGGELDQADYRAMLGRMDAILVCSREDTAPLVSIDALSAERLLLLTRAVGTSAWLNDGEEALIEQEASAAAMSRLYERALAAWPDRMRIGSAARARFDQTFAWDTFVNQLEKEIVAARDTFFAVSKNLA
ncbi:glycosyltransferase family 4 protein [Qipengyuania spongiae]|uniref:Glycosyltransferase family 4 protein n=1 Tax=Qipengyuania spongiae TaxID=2909673 RepID=A0ABY5T685_9SPHN|nr:glycosyltransferase family 4 protein [Qipengyuania spongiae]UVI40851.1 glycosyltransferase family 4 protein [Qipengyuania spongiae]